MAFMLRFVALAAVAAPGAASALAEWSNESGAEGCPCAGREYVDRVVGQFEPLDPFYADLPQGYGVQCGQHDRSSPRTRSRGHCLPAGGQPAWCSSAWCFVDAACDLPRKPSQVAPGLFYSYETCGYLDRFEPAVRQVPLQNMTLRAVFMTNTGGWKGSYCAGAKCSGPLASYMEALLEEAEAQLDVKKRWTRYRLRSEPMAYGPAVSQQIYADDPDQDNVFTACAYATGMGYLDVCIGVFHINEARRSLSDFIEVFQEPVYLVARRRDTSTTLWDHLVQIGAPFSGDLWLAIAGSVLGFVFLNLFLEKAPGGCLEHRPWPKALGDSAYLTLQFFLTGGPVHEPSGVGGKLAALGMSFIVLVTIASYTAELASYLLAAKQPEAAIRGLDDVRRRGMTVCVSGTMTKQLVELGVAMENIRGRLARGDVLPAVQTGDCDVAAMRLEDFTKAQEEGEFCGMMRVGDDPIFTVPNGVPVSPRVRRQLDIMSMAMKGSAAWEDAKERFEPISGCSRANGGDELTGMSLEQLLGMFFVSGGFIVMSLSAELWKRLARRQAALKVAQLDDEGGGKACLEVVVAKPASDGVEGMAALAEAVHELRAIADELRLERAAKDERPGVDEVLKLIEQLHH